MLSTRITGHGLTCLKIDTEEILPIASLNDVECITFAMPGSWLSWVTRSNLPTEIHTLLIEVFNGGKNKNKKRPFILFTFPVEISIATHDSFLDSCCRIRSMAGCSTLGVFPMLLHASARRFWPIVSCQARTSGWSVFLFDLPRFCLRNTRWSFVT